MQTPLSITALESQSPSDEEIRGALYSGCAQIEAAHIINTQTASHVRHDYPVGISPRCWDDVNQHLQRLWERNSADADLIAVEFTCLTFEPDGSPRFFTLLASTGSIDHDWLGQMTATTEDHERMDTFISELEELVPHPLHLHVSVRADVPRVSRTVHFPYFIIAIPETSHLGCQTDVVLEEAFDPLGSDWYVNHMVYYCDAEDAPTSSLIDLAEWVHDVIAQVNDVVVAEMGITDAALCIHIYD